MEGVLTVSPAGLTVRFLGGHIATPQQAIYCFRHLLVYHPTGAGHHFHGNFKSGGGLCAPTHSFGYPGGGPHHPPTSPIEFRQLNPTGWGS